MFQLVQIYINQVDLWIILGFMGEICNLYLVSHDDITFNRIDQTHCY